jgi:hypothetical protein
MREAERLDPAKGICVLILLEKLGRKDEAERYANRFLGEHGHGAVYAGWRGLGGARWEAAFDRSLREYSRMSRFFFPVFLLLPTNIAYKSR